MSAAHWIANVNRKQRMQLRAFILCIILFITTVVALAALRRLNSEDLVILPLLFSSIIATFPYISVAHAGGGIFKHGIITATGMRNNLAMAQNHVLLSSAMHVLQPVYVALSIVNMILYIAHKVDVQIVHKNFIIMLLAVQTPFNPVAGYNPIGRMLLTMPPSKRVTLTDVKMELEQQAQRANNAPRNNAPRNIIPRNNTPRNIIPRNNTPRFNTLQTPSNYGLQLLPRTPNSRPRNNNPVVPTPPPMPPTPMIQR